MDVFRRLPYNAQPSVLEAPVTSTGMRHPRQCDIKAIGLRRPGSEYRPLKLMYMDMGTLYIVIYSQ